MPYYERVKEVELEAGGTSLDQSRPLITDHRRVSFATSSSHPRPRPNIGLSDIRVCNCSGPPTVRLGNICTRCGFQRSTPICECAQERSDVLPIPPLREGGICSMCKFLRVQLQMPKPFSVFKNTSGLAYLCFSFYYIVLL